MIKVEPSKLNLLHFIPSFTCLCYLLRLIPSFTCLCPLPSPFVFWILVSRTADTAIAAKFCKCSTIAYQLLSNADWICKLLGLCKIWKVPCRWSWTGDMFALIYRLTIDYLYLVSLFLWKNFLWHVVWCLIIQSCNVSADFAYRNLA